MRILESTLKEMGPGRVLVTTLLELTPAVSRDDLGAPAGELGEGPTGAAIPDRIVKCLIRRHPEPVSLSVIRHEVGGNPATVNRQAWTLAANATDLQLRLRGWVISPERGKYALSPAARARLGL